MLLLHEKHHRMQNRHSTLGLPPGVLRDNSMLNVYRFFFLNQTKKNAIIRVSDTDY